MNVNSKPSNRVKLFLPLLIIIIIAFNFTSIGKSTQNNALSLTSSIKSSFWSRGISMHADEFNSQNPDSALISEIVTLRKELEEMNKLREALDLEMHKEFKFLDSRVAGSSAKDDHIIISRGKNDGILEGMAVLTSSKSLVGEVTLVLSDFSHIKLITHPEISFDAKILDKEDSLGVVKSGEKLTLEMIDRNVNLEVGDRAITHPGGGIYPGGIFIGEVKEVIRDDAEAFQSAVIEPAISPSDLTFLFVLVDF